MTEATKSILKRRDITAQAKARNPVIWVKSREEHRIEGELFQGLADAGFLPHTWDMAAGTKAIDGSEEEFTLNDGRRLPKSDPDALLDMIGERTGSRDAWILRDFPVWIEGGGAGAITLRRLRSLARPDGLPAKVPDDAQVIVILSPLADVPPELANHVSVMDWPLPDRQEVSTMLDTTVQQHAERIFASPKNQKDDGTTKLSVEQIAQKIRNGSFNTAVDAAVGLSGEEAQATFARSLVTKSKIDPATINAEKKRIIARDGLLEWIDPAPENRPRGLARVGGADLFKEHLADSALAYSPEAREYGIQTPRGVFLMGVSGCGKSELAKAIPEELGVPLIRVDLGKMKSKYVGDSEAQLRQGLDTIDAMGACVAWFDEVEKALQGATSGSADGGVSADALGTVLTWMQERQGQAYIVMTANDITSLPPELMRKGRFDETFWVDLPTTVERAQIVAATLPKHPKGDGSIRTAEGLGIDLQAVAEATEEFSGAEMAALVPDALKIAFRDGMREPTTKDFIVAAGRIVPMAKQQAKKLKNMRDEWAGRTRPASSPETAKKTAGQKVRQIDIDN